MTTETPRFIHLRVRTALSLLQSMIRPKDLANWAKDTAAPAVGVTDDNLFAALELAEALTEAGVQSITGLTLDIVEPGVGAEQGKLALIVQNETGYRNLMELSSRSFLSPAGDGRQVALAAVLEHAEGLICLSVCLAGQVNQHILRNQEKEAEKLVKWYAKVFGDDFYLEIQNNGTVACGG